MKAFEKPATPAVGSAFHYRAILKPGLYMLLPEANRVVSHLPGYAGVEFQVLANARLGAQFVQVEWRILPNGQTERPVVEDCEHFLYVLEGELNLTLGGKKNRLDKGGFAWLPPQTPLTFKNESDSPARGLWIRKRYQGAEGIKTPGVILANERDISRLQVDTYLEQHLTPYEDPAFDMGINLQTFDPGVLFSAAEAHVMEHGLYMLAGKGVYWLDRDIHEVEKNDFIYMAPFCSQFYRSGGKEPSAYLLYKDVNRDDRDALTAPAGKNPAHTDNPRRMGSIQDVNGEWT